MASLKMIPTYHSDQAYLILDEVEAVTVTIGVGGLGNADSQLLLDVIWLLSGKLKQVKDHVDKIDYECVAFALEETTKLVRQALALSVVIGEGDLSNVDSEKVSRVMLLIGRLCEQAKMKIVKIEPMAA